MTPYINFHFSTIWPIRKGTLKHHFDSSNRTWISRSGGEFDSSMFAVAVEYMAPIILMHMPVASEWNKSLKNGDNVEVVGAGDKKEKDQKNTYQHWNHLRDDAQTCWYIMHHNATIDTSLQEKRIDFCSGRERLKPWIRWQNMSPWWRRLWNFRDFFGSSDFSDASDATEHSRWVITFSNDGKQQKLRVYHVGTSCVSAQDFFRFQFHFQGFHIVFPEFQGDFKIPRFVFFLQDLMAQMQQMLLKPAKVRSGHWLCQGFGT